MRLFHESTKGPARRRGSNPYGPAVMVLALLLLLGQAIWVARNERLFAPFALDRIVCDPCAGTGVVHDERRPNALLLCPGCFGVGSRMVRYMDKEDGLCPACVGLGRKAYDGAWESCRRCGGRGLVRAEPWSAESIEPPPPRPLGRSVPVTEDPEGKIEAEGDHVR